MSSGGAGRERGLWPLSEPLARNTEPSVMNERVPGPVEHTGAQNHPAEALAPADGVQGPARVAPARQRFDRYVSSVPRATLARFIFL